MEKPNEKSKPNNKRKKIKLNTRNLRCWSTEFSFVFILSRDSFNILGVSWKIFVISLFFYWLALKARFIISCMCIHCQTQRWVLRAVDLSFVNILKPLCLDLRWVKNSCCSKSFPITYMAGRAIGTMVTNSIFLFSGSKELELVGDYFFALLSLRPGSVVSRVLFICP